MILRSCIILRLQVLWKAFSNWIYDQETLWNVWQVQKLYLGACVHSIVSRHLFLFHRCNLMNRNKCLHRCFKLGADFPSFKRDKLLVFLVDHLTAISWIRDCNVFKNIFTVFPLLMQNWILTKINFLGSANKT